jgi:hypothetical protein
LDWREDFNAFDHLSKPNSLHVLHIDQRGFCWPCTESVGQNRIYAINIADGFPLRKFETTIVDGKEVTTVKTATADDWFETLKQGVIAPELAFLFPGADQVVCLSGAEVLGSCKSFNCRMKTFWQESGAE